MGFGYCAVFVVPLHSAGVMMVVGGQFMVLVVEDGGEGGWDNLLKMGTKGPSGK